MPTLCFIIHGIGDPGADYARPLIAGIDRQIDKIIEQKRKGKVSGWDTTQPSHCVNYHTIYWANIATDEQVNLFRKLYPELFVASWIGRTWQAVSRFGFARNLSVNLLGDVFSYLGNRQSEIKRSVLATVKKALDDAFESREAVSIIVVGHSLGTVIIHDLINSFLRLGYANFNVLVEHTSIFTLGSPISLFSLVTQSARPDRFRKWVNFYHPCDQIGFPMQKLASFSKVRDEQIGIWHPNPLAAHSCYWKHSKVHQRIADEIVEHREKKVGVVPAARNTGPLPPDILQPLTGAFNPAGLVECHMDFRDVQFKDLILAAREIDFCNVYGGDWLERWSPDFQIVLQRPEVRVRACITAPDAPTLAALSYHFNDMPADALKAKIEKAKASLIKAWEAARSKTSTPGKLEIYLCRTQVNYAFYRFDELLYFTPRALSSKKHGGAFPVPCFVYRKSGSTVGAHDWMMRDFTDALETARDTTKIYESP